MKRPIRESAEDIAKYLKDRGLTYREMKAVLKMAVIINDRKYK